MLCTANSMLCIKKYLLVQLLVAFPGTPCVVPLLLQQAIRDLGCDEFTWDFQATTQIIESQSLSPTVTRLWH